MTLVIPQSPIHTLPVAGGGQFPVRRIYCIGRNYAAHTREMGGDPEREAPFFFQKPADAILPPGETMPYPPQTDDLHHELELVVAIGQDGADIIPSDALRHVFGYGVGFDMTRRDLQGVAKKAGRPWEVGKAFDHSAPCSSLSQAAIIGHPVRGRLWCDVNGQRRQTGDLADMIWSVAEIIATLSRYGRLVAGDLIFTGTPEGVAAVVPGDVLEGHIEGVGQLRVMIGERVAGGRATGGRVA